MTSKPSWTANQFMWAHKLAAGNEREMARMGSADRQAFENRLHRDAEDRQRPWARLQACLTLARSLMSDAS